MPRAAEALRRVQVYVAREWSCVCNALRPKVPSVGRGVQRKAASYAVPLLIFDGAVGSSCVYTGLCEEQEK